MSTPIMLATEPVDGNPERPRPVLVTGAAGRIGSSFAEYAHERYALRLLVRDRQDADTVRAWGEPAVADLCGSADLRDVFAGIDTVVHLAADPSPQADWDSVRDNNLVATYTTFAAAVAAGCRRIVFASSIHAVSGYPDGYQVHAADPVNPGDLYGVSKCFGEALARMAAVQDGLSAIVVRIGSFQPRTEAVREENIAMMNSFVSHRDLNQLITRCIDDRKLRFAVFHGLSGNRFNRMDISAAQEWLGYAPADDFTDLNRDLADLDLRRRVKPHDARHDKGTTL